MDDNKKIILARLAVRFMLGTSLILIFMSEGRINFNFYFAIALFTLSIILDHMIWKRQKRMEKCGKGKDNYQG
jgi:hypothetical protein